MQLVKDSKIVDTNVILRYLLSDVPKLAARSADLLENEVIYLPFELLAETVYVLEKVYTVSRQDISDSLTHLLKYKNISTYDSEIAFLSMKIYKETKLDFIDALLCAYKKARNVEVVSFDKELNKYLAD